MNRTFASLLRILLLAAALMPAVARGGDFVELRSADYPVGDELPRYTTVVPLGRDYASGGYTVRVEYPEFAPLTSAEARLLRQGGIVLPDTLVAESYVGIVRKEGQLDVSLVPFVLRDGRPMRLVSFKLAVEPRTVTAACASRAARAATQRWADTSVLATGKWVKIRVDREGIYQLTDAALKAMGFSRPDHVRLYGYGGRIQPETFDFDDADCPADDLEQVPLLRTGQGALFFAEGTERWTLSGTQWTHTNNTYSSYSYYFLTESDDAPAALGQLSATSAATTTVSQVTDHALVDNDAYSWFSGGRRFYDSYDFATGNSHTYTLATPGIVAGTSAKVDVRFSAANKSGSTAVAVSVGGNSLGTMTLSALGEYGLASEAERSYTTTGLGESNAFRLTSTAGVSGRLDYIRVSYTRQLAVGSEPLVFTAGTSNPVRFVVGGATATTRLWRIGRAGDPTAEVAATLADGTLEAPVDDGSRRYVVFDASAVYPAPTVVGDVANQNLHADRDIDMVIIVPASGQLTAEAERLAEAHRTQQGLTVKVVSADLIYNEFSSGTPDATAYRRYLKMLYDRGDEGRMPGYLLFFGDCAWDNRMLTSAWRGKNPDDYLLAYESLNSVDEIQCYATDDYFGMLDDGEGANVLREKMDVAVGRFTCNTADEAKVFVDKVLSYMGNEHAGSWQNRLCFLADDGDDNLHMRGAQSVINAIGSLADDFIVQPIYWDAYVREVTATSKTYPKVREKLTSLMESGALVMNYMGHGDPERVSHENVLTIADFQTIRTNHLPLWVLASCEVTPYDSGEDNIGRSGMLNPSGGGIAFICASRTVYSNRNETLNQALMNFLLATDDNGDYYTMGEALMAAKNRLVETNGDRTTNRVKYTLTGDPALRLARPTEGVVVDSLNGQALAAGETLQLEAGSTVRVSGRVVAAAGGTLDGFKGVVSATVYDRKETVTCNNNDGSATTPYTYTDRTKVVFEGSDSVRSGRFALSFRVPVDISYSTDNGRIVLYAVDDGHTTEAHGANEQFYLDGTSSEATGDDKGPDIYVYLNRPDFPDGGQVGTTPVFFAEIADSSGINTTGNGVGHDLELTIVGETTDRYVLNDYFAYDLGSSSRGSVSYQLPELEEGHYTLKFRAWDILNNPTTAELAFTVVEGLAPQLSLRATQNPARGSTSFLFTYDRPGAEGLFTVEVYDLSGRRLWSRSASGASASGSLSVPWDLTDSSGAPLGGGLYLFRGRITVDGTTTETKADKIIILKQ